MFNFLLRYCMQLVFISESKKVDLININGKIIKGFYKTLNISIYLIMLYLTHFLK